MTKYNPSTIEHKWQKIWEESGIYEPGLVNAPKPFGKTQGKPLGASPRGEPFYNLMMFPYPSAEGLHVGNMYAFTGADIYGRFKRMQGYDVFEPIGLDGFGIHSENYALRVGRHPAQLAKETEKNFYRQLRATGNGYAWKEKLESYDPNYYKWTQWIFVQMFKRGLAYRGKAPVNWCPSCKTVLADEQVINGACERCKTQVERKQMEQWFFKITRYAERLLKNLEKINWSEKVKIAQRNWIGKSEGVEINFPILRYKQSLLLRNKDIKILSAKKKNSSNILFDSVELAIRRLTDRVISQYPSISVFTTRPDTLFGATFMVLAPEHPIVASLLNSKFNPSTSLRARIQNSKLEEIRSYVERARKKTEEERIAEGKDKTGVFTGLYAINPVNNEKIPIWVADYVLMEYGTGAIMGVPAHDQRDYDFAKKYQFTIIEVIKGGDIRKVAYDGEGPLVNSGPWNGWNIPREMEKVILWLEENKIGQRKITYHLRDWLISRQRYWGPPIPMINCSKCGWQPVPEEDLPVLLPKVEDWRPKGTGKSPLANIESFVKTTCPKCSGEADRETDVSDTFLDSAWYFLRYPSIGISGNSEDQKTQSIGESDNQNIRASENQRVRNSDSADSADLSDYSDPLSSPSFPNILPWDREITRRWLPVDMYVGGAEHAVLHLLYSRFMTMVFNDLELIDFEEPYERFYAHGLLISEGAKMSKSKGNIVVPDAYIERYGADCLRCYLMFLGPFNQGGDFRDAGILGIWRFLNRVWNLVAALRSPATGPAELHPHPMSSPSTSLRVRALDGGPPRSSPVAAPRATFDLERARHRTIRKVTEDIENLRYNTALSALMEYLNELKVQSEKLKVEERKEAIKTLLLLLAPFAPHMTEELWSRMSADASIHLHPWPKYDPEIFKETMVTVVACINGKTRDQLDLSSDAASDRGEVEKLSRQRAKIAKYLAGAKIKRVVFVPGKLINFVI